MQHEPNTQPIPTPDAIGGEPAPPTVHLYVLLDRSGSMEAIRREVVGGFNAFLAGQQIDGADARLTLVQFDTFDLAETVVDDCPVRQVRPLQARDFQPRGGTPLLDATGHLLARAKARTEARAAAGRPERIVVVTVTDGLENASRELTRADIRELVTEREAEGWLFVYLSAALDAYDEGASFGYAPGSTQAWAPDAGGASLAFSSLDRAVRGVRGKVRVAASVAAHDLFEGEKPAEEDRRRKRGDQR